MTIANCSYPANSRLVLLLILLLHTAASFYYIARQNITHDEPHYIEYAKRWLHGHPDRIVPFDDSKSPVVAICWLPRITRQMINPGYHLTDYGRKDQAEGRYMMILFSFLTAIYVYRWCKDLYGSSGWQLPLLFLLFDPLYLAYSTLITTDLACGAFLVAILYHFRKYLLYRQRKELLFAAIFAGIGIVTKQTIIFSVVLLPMLSIIWHLCHKRLATLISSRSLFNSLAFCVILIVTINLLYYFDHLFVPLKNYNFQSHNFQDIQASLSWINGVPVPFPKSFIQSLDMLQAHAELGAGKPESTYNGVYLFGQLKLSGTFGYYYFVLLWFKTPIGTLLLFAVSVFLLLKKFKTKSFADRYMFLVIPVLFFVVLVSFFNKFQIGIRHLLLVFPLLFIGCGYVLAYYNRSGVAYKVLIAVLLCINLVSVAVYYPDLIPYTNELVRDKKTVYTMFADNSIDYGQSDDAVANYRLQHREIKETSPIPGSGRFIVTIHDLIYSAPKGLPDLSWYTRFKPVDVYRHVGLLYNITSEDLRNAKLLDSATYLPK